jgi:tetratricopeptide (TPR) repeat protein
LDEPRSIAVVWHQTGNMYERAGQPEAAEDAYRQSLAIQVRLGDVAGQAHTLTQLGNLYKNFFNGTEQAAALYQQAAANYADLRDAANEGKARSGLAIALRILRRFDEARQQILLAVDCKSPFGHAAEPWKTWSILADIEAEADNPAAAAQAKRKAIDCYLAYRRHGGENHNLVECNKHF